MKTKFGTVKLGSGGYYRITSEKEGNSMKYLHRLIWEDFFKCKIPKGYVVHHKNGNKQDNCIMNLELMSSYDHNQLHMKGENHPMYGVRGKDHYNYGRKHSAESRRRNSEGHTRNYSRIVKMGRRYGKQLYCIKRGKSVIKQSVYPSRLMNWFTTEYPNEMLVLI